jgi:hypothetical protein
MFDKFGRAGEIRRLLQNYLHRLSDGGEKHSHPIGRIGRAGEIRTRDLLHPKPNSLTRTRCPVLKPSDFSISRRVVEACRYVLKSEAPASYILTTLRVCNQNLSSRITGEGAGPMRSNYRIHSSRRPAPEIRLSITGRTPLNQPEHFPHSHIVPAFWCGRPLRSRTGPPSASGVQRQRVPRPAAMPR